MSQQPTRNPKGTWMTYRPDIKIHDCTVRDGGLINNHQFEDGFVKAVYNTLVAAGVDYMELGYKADKKIFSPASNGKWKFCTEDDMRAIVGDNPTDLKLSVMADAERTDYQVDILPKEKSVIDMVRVATYIHQMPTAIDMIKDAHDKGYETACNLMSVSTVPDRELLEALDMVVKTAPVDVLYVVDSFGSLYSEQVHYLVQSFLRATDGTAIQIGIHTHNNQELAYANTIEALINGASRADATIGGMGRGAGNCCLELLMGFLKNPKFRLRPVIECLRDHALPLKTSGKMDWGFSIPYMITGQLNLHPRAAIEMMDGKGPDNIVAFYDKMVEEE